MNESSLNETRARMKMRTHGFWIFVVFIVVLMLKYFVMSFWNMISVLHLDCFFCVCICVLLLWWFCIDHCYLFSKHYQVCIICLYWPRNELFKLVIFLIWLLFVIFIVCTFYNVHLNILQSSTISYIFVLCFCETKFCRHIILFDRVVFIYLLFDFSRILFTMLAQ